MWSEYLLRLILLLILFIILHLHRLPLHYPEAAAFGRWFLAKLNPYSALIAAQPKHHEVNRMRIRKSVQVQDEEEDKDEEEEQAGSP